MRTRTRYGLPSGGPLPDAATSISDQEDPLTDSYDSDKAALDVLLEHHEGADAPFDADWSSVYLDVISNLLRKTLGEELYAAPVRQVAAHLRVNEPPPPLPVDDDLEAAYCKASAEISFLVMNGASEDVAAQKTARQILALGIPLPQTGGDARGWVRLQLWRDRLRLSREPSPLYAAYRYEFNRLKEERRSG